MPSLELRIPPVVVTALFACLMWLLAELTPFLVINVPYRSAFTGILVLLGAASVVAGIVAFGKASTTSNPVRPEDASVLVTSGIYRATRNPMYLGFLLALIGWTFRLGNPLSILIIPVYVMYMNRLQIVPEERVLSSKFGESFDAYVRSTRRWI